MRILFLIFDSACCIDLRKRFFSLAVDAPAEPPIFDESTNWSSSEQFEKFQNSFNAFMSHGNPLMNLLFSKNHQPFDKSNLNIIQTVYNGVLSVGLLPEEKSNNALVRHLKDLFTKISIIDFVNLIKKESIEFGKLLSNPPENESNIEKLSRLLLCVQVAGVTRTLHPNTNEEENGLNCLEDGIKAVDYMVNHQKDLIYKFLPSLFMKTAEAILDKSISDKKIESNEAFMKIQNLKDTSSPSLQEIIKFSILYLYLSSEDGEKVQKSHNSLFRIFVYDVENLHNLFTYGSTVKFSYDKSSEIEPNAASKRSFLDNLVEIGTKGVMKAFSNDYVQQDSKMMKEMKVDGYIFIILSAQFKNANELSVLYEKAGKLAASTKWVIIVLSLLAVLGVVAGVGLYFF